MGSVITVKGKAETILAPEDDLRDLILEHMGSDARDLYDEVLWDAREEYLDDMEDPEDNPEAESYRNQLIDVMNELQEIVYASRLDRKRLERLWQSLHKSL